jgi:hypothetical protein
MSDVLCAGSKAAMNKCLSWPPEFGLMPYGQELKDVGVPRWRVMPQPGLLLLFPSHCAHRIRISVAFDVTPSA